MTRTWQRIANDRFLWTLLAAVAVGLLLARLPALWGAAVVAAAAVGLLILVQPQWGLGLALLLGPFGALENVLGLSVAGLDSGQFVLLITFAAWTARQLRDRQLAVRSTPLQKVVWLFVFVTAVTLPAAPSATAGVRELIKWIEIALILWMIADWGQRVNERGRRALLLRLLTMLLLAGLLQAAIGIWQFGLRGDGPEHFLILERFYRAYGTFEQPNPFGGYMHLNGLLALGTLLGMTVLLWQRWRHGHGEMPPLWVTGLVLATAVLATAALIFSWSRGAWLSFAAGTAVLVLFWPRRLRWGVALAVAGVLLLGSAWQTGALPASVTARLSSFQDDFTFGDVRGVDINDANYAVLERLAHWQAALDMARNNVWLGVGFGNYEAAYDDYALINWPDALGHAHNYYLNVLAETGVFGLAAYLLLWTAVFVYTIRALRQPDWFLRGIVLGLLAAWMALSVHHLVDKLYVNNIYIYLAVMLGILQLLAQEKSSLISC